jgi:hypothetical protein
MLILMVIHPLTPRNSSWLSCGTSLKDILAKQALRTACKIYIGKLQCHYLRLKILGNNLEFFLQANRTWLFISPKKVYPSLTLMITGTIPLLDVFVSISFREGTTFSLWLAPNRYSMNLLNDQIETTSIFNNIFGTG